MQHSGPPPEVLTDLASIYEEVMWLADRPNTTPTAARAWYTHVASGRLRRHIRQFTGMVSREAAKADAPELRLEHFKRIQTTLTKLVAEHRKAGSRNVEEFTRVVLDCEQVHVVTKRENYDAMKAKGDYMLAGIALVHWHELPAVRQKTLWSKVLRGKVSNAVDFAPTADRPKET